MNRTLFKLVAVCAVLNFACGRENINSNRISITNATINTAPTVNVNSIDQTELKMKVERELRKSGFNHIIFDTTTSPPTLKGEYPKGRLAELIQIARLASGGEVQNGAVEAK